MICHCLSKQIKSTMSIQLYDHNQKAYDAVVSMLAETNKVVVVHPTGTGKSFIVFKLCEENPSKKVLWLSPSEYIFKTQVENLKATGADVPQNIQYMTYARLMRMSESEMTEFHPDIVVLDEMHRAGSPRWGESVKSLLSLNPNALILGLSAIRYLDNQRDMAEEFFDGNVASEITLGDAIVRGILNPPKYVLSVFPIRKNKDELGISLRVRLGELLHNGREVLSAIWQSNVPVTYRTYDGLWLGRWVQRQRLKTTGMNGNQVMRLEQVGMVWEMQAI